MESKPAAGLTHRVMLVARQNLTSFVSMNVQFTTHVLNDCHHKIDQNIDRTLPDCSEYFYYSIGSAAANYTSY